MSGDQIDNKTVKDSVDLFSALYNNLSDDRGVYFVNSSEETNYISYTELYSKAKCQLAFLTSKGLKANDELIFQINENSKFLITFWACILGKIKAVPINPANTPETRKKLINVWNTLDSPYIIATDKIHQNLHSKLNEYELRNFSANKLILFDDGFEQYELCNDIRLVAYIVHEPHVTKENIKDEIALFMPDFMVPSYFVSMEEIPRNMNGKIDKSKLPDIEMINETEIVLPENELEEQLLRIWQEVLGDTNFGITNKFFELGGNSLKAIQVINRVRQELMIELTVKDLFGKDIIKELADTVLEKQLEDFDDDELLGLLEE